LATQSRFHRLAKDETMSSVRPATVGDARQIAKVHVDSWRTTYSGIVPEDFLAAMSYEDVEASWRGLLGSESGVRGVYYVAELPAGDIVGFASGGPREGGSYPGYEGELYTTYVLRQYQRRGLGRRLLGAVARGLLEDDKRSMLAWVLTQNPSRSFYEAAGGTLLGSQEIEVGGATLEEVAYGWDDIRSLATSA
jgi:GNAT superfamily N-acetyltransferase